MKYFVNGEPIQEKYAIILGSIKKTINSAPLWFVQVNDCINGDIVEYFEFKKFSEAEEKRLELKRKYKNLWKKGEIIKSLPDYLDEIVMKEELYQE